MICESRPISHDTVQILNGLRGIEITREGASGKPQMVRFAKEMDDEAFSQAWNANNIAIGVFLKDRLDGIDCLPSGNLNNDIIRLKRQIFLIKERESEVGGNWQNVRFVYEDKLYELLQIKENVISESKKQELQKRKNQDRLWKMKQEWKQDWRDLSKILENERQSLQDQCLKDPEGTGDFWRDENKSLL